MINVDPRDSSSSRDLKSLKSRVTVSRATPIHSPISVWVRAQNKRVPRSVGWATAHCSSRNRTSFSDAVTVRPSLRTCSQALAHSRQSSRATSTRPKGGALGTQKVITCNRRDHAGGYSLCGNIVAAFGKMQKQVPAFLQHMRPRGSLACPRSNSGRASPVLVNKKEDIVRRLLFGKQSGSGWVVGKGSKRFKFEAFFR